jgi:hypothetical protein
MEKEKPVYNFLVTGFEFWHRLSNRRVGGEEREGRWAPNDSNQANTDRIHGSGFP